MMRWRVVCALDVMIDRREPSMAFISVDLPTLGLPTMLTKPARCGGDDAVGAAASVGAGAAGASSARSMRGLTPSCDGRLDGCTEKSSRPLAGREAAMNHVRRAARVIVISVAQTPRLGGVRSEGAPAGLVMSARIWTHTVRRVCRCPYERCRVLL